MTQSNKDSTHHPLNNLPLIRASELAQYSFCHRAWWLGSVKKIRSDNQASLSRGRNVHIRHEQQVQSATRWQKMGFLLIAAGSLFLFMMMMWLWFGGGG